MTFTAASQSLLGSWNVAHLYSLWYKKASTSPMLKKISTTTTLTTTVSLWPNYSLTSWFQFKYFKTTETQTIKWMTKLQPHQTLNLTHLTFPNRLGSKWNLYSIRAEEAVNILCAICYYLVPETINHTAVCPIWLTQPFPSGLLWC